MCGYAGKAIRSQWLPNTGMSLASTRHHRAPQQRTAGRTHDKEVLLALAPMNCCTTTTRSIWYTTRLRTVLQYAVPPLLCTVFGSYIFPQKYIINKVQKAPATKKKCLDAAQSTSIPADILLLYCTDNLICYTSYVV